MNVIRFRVSNKTASVPTLLSHLMVNHTDVIIDDDPHSWQAHAGTQVVFGTCWCATQAATQELEVHAHEMSTCCMTVHVYFLLHTAFLL